MGNGLIFPYPPWRVLPLRWQVSDGGTQEGSPSQAVVVLG
jgi:hypothetical protein